MTTPTRSACALLAALALCGCASTLSGVGGSDSYACKAPAGAMCTSISGVYANSLQGPARPVGQPATTGGGPAAATPPAIPADAPGNPLRSNPRILRLWIAPWEDGDGDLHEAAVVHVVVDGGRWLIEHVRPIARDPVDGVAPPAATAAQDPVPARLPSPAPARFAPPPAVRSSGGDAAPLEP